MNRINIIGLGPGCREYITPAALELIKKSDIIIGGKRNLESVDTDGKITVNITDNLEDISLFIKNNYKIKNISVVASGDPGFFGILSFLLKKFERDELNIVPGISSLQYMFAKIGCTWDDAYFGSLHGRDENIAETASRYRKAAYLTDEKRSCRYIAEKLTEAGYGDRMMYVGINLSYDDEKIIRDKAGIFAGTENNYKLCVVAVIDEK